MRRAPAKLQKIQAKARSTRWIGIGNTTALATSRRVPQDIRGNLVRRLASLEHSIRLLVTVEAITFLIMTPEDRLASLLHDILSPPEQGEIPSRWRYGRPEWFNVCALAQCLFVLFDQFIAPGLAGLSSTAPPNLQLPARSRSYGKRSVHRQSA